MDRALTLALVTLVALRTPAAAQTATPSQAATQTETPTSTTSAQTQERSNLAIWQDALRYGTDPEVLSVIGSIRDAREQSLSADLGRLAAASRNPQVRIAILGYLEDLADPSAREAAAGLLARHADTDAASLRAAMTYLGAIHATEAKDDLLAVAASTDASSAATAVRTLAKLGLAEVTDPLLEIYHAEATPEAVRQEIILALGELKATGALDLLRGIVADRDAERVTRMYAAASLGRIGDPGSVPTLTALLSEDDALIRSYAAAALGRLRAPGVAEALLQVLRDSSWQVRVEAARAVADGAAEGAVTDELQGMMIYRARRDDVSQVRLEAIRALGTIGGADCIAALRELYVGTNQPLDVRGAALAQLLKSDLTGSMDSIRKVVDSEWTARSQKTLEVTAAKLSETVSPAIADLLGRFLDSANIAVKVAGIRGIARNGLTQYADGLRKTAAGGNVSLRREALAALEKLGLAAQAPAASP